jgi:arsenate reductase
MAEGWLRHLAGDRAASLSAGSEPAGFVHPLAVRVMAERGIDIDSHRSKSIREFLGAPPDVVVSVCDSAARDCPVFPGKVARLHWPFDDPAHAEGSEEEKLAVFRRVRDQIGARIRKELESLLGA